MLQNSFWCNHMYPSSYWVREMLFESGWPTKLSHWWFSQFTRLELDTLFKGDKCRTIWTNHQLDMLQIRILIKTPAGLGSGLLAPSVRIFPILIRSNPKINSYPCDQLLSGSWVTLTKQLTNLTWMNSTKIKPNIWTSSTNQFHFRLVLPYFVYLGLRLWVYMNILLGLYLICCYCCMYEHLWWFSMVSCDRLYNEDPKNKHMRWPTVKVLLA